MSRKKISARHNNRQRIQFAYNADRDLPIGQVFQYLLKSELVPRCEGKQKGLNAISAFWKPFAYKDNDHLSEEEKLAIARESIETLTRQIALIRATLMVKSASSLNNTTEGTGAFSQEVRTAMTEVMQELLASGFIATTGAVGATPQAACALSNAVQDRIRALVMRVKALTLMKRPCSAAFLTVENKGFSSIVFSSFLQRTGSVSIF